MNIHPTAVVDPKATLGSGVSIGPLTIIEAGAVIGDDCQIAGHVQLLGQVILGEGCRVGPGAVLGGLPQDRSFDTRVSSGVRLGRGNDIREHVTIHRSTQEGGWTTLGDGNLLMVGSHLGHDCQMGNDNALANNCLLGGHVHVGNGVFFGGGSVFHQFVRVGDHVLAQGISGFSLDLPPFVIGSGTNGVSGLNSIGLRRAGFDSQTRGEIKEIFRLFYRENFSRQQALAEAGGRTWGHEAQRFLDFVQADSKKGLCLRTPRDR